MREKGPTEANCAADAKAGSPGRPEGTDERLPGAAHADEMRREESACKREKVEHLSEVDGRDVVRLVACDRPRWPASAVSVKTG